MVWEQMALFALRGVTVTSQLSCAMDNPAPSGTFLLLHVYPVGYFEYYIIIPVLTVSFVCIPISFENFNCFWNTLLVIVYFSSVVLIRWRMDPWSPCSTNCGGGSQSRSVRCMKGPEGKSREVEGQHCLGTGRRPSDTRLCNLQPCARWATTHWGAVSRFTLNTNTS